MTTKKETPENVLVLKITLLDTAPPIWRRLHVPEQITLGDLHYVIQIAMGWTNSHMHEFEMGKKRYGTVRQDDAWSDEDLLNEEEATVGKTFSGRRKRILYRYDFGDDWEHEVLYETLVGADPKKKYPLCTEGELACPPDDCGGPWGYYTLLQVIRDASHPRHKEMTEWLGGEFDPSLFSASMVNRKLRHIKHLRKLSEEWG